MCLLPFLPLLCLNIISVILYIHTHTHTHFYNRLNGFFTLWFLNYFIICESSKLLSPLNSPSNPWAENVFLSHCVAKGTASQWSAVYWTNTWCSCLYFQHSAVQQAGQGHLSKCWESLEHRSAVPLTPQLNPFTFLRLSPNLDWLLELILERRKWCPRWDWHPEMSMSGQPQSQRPGHHTGQGRRSHSCSETEAHGRRVWRSLQWQLCVDHRIWAYCFGSLEECVAH